MLLLDAAGEPLTVLPTHRVVRGLGDDGVARLLAGLDDLFDGPPRRRRATSCVARFEAAALAPGGAGSVRALDADRRRAPDRPSRRLRAVPADGWRGPPRRSMSRLLGVALERLAGIDADAVAAGAIAYTKSAVGGGRPASTPAPTAPTRRSSSSRRRSRRSRGRRRRRRDAPEVDLLLSEGPDRPRHQPARMVNRACPIRRLSRSSPAPRCRRPTAARSARTRSSSTSAGIYVESWLPERRSRRKPLLFVHGELGGSWLWERYLGYFAARGWEGHALNLRNHYWSQTADPATLSFDTYTEDVVATLERFRPASSWSATGWAACSRSRRPSGCRSSGLVLLERGAAARPAGPGAPARTARDPRGLRQVGRSAGRRSPSACCGTSAT